MTNTINVLDHGYVTLLNISGPVRRIDTPYDADSIDPAKTARISFGGDKVERKRSTDLKLVQYLIDHRHTTPLEMIEVWFEEKLPLFVRSQFVRHRTATINEQSGRYTEFESDFYIPENFRKKSETNKQGSGENFDTGMNGYLQHQMRAHCESSYVLYKKHVI